MKGTPNPEECTYTVWVQTGTDDDAGTSSVIGLTLAPEPYSQNEVKIDNLTSWSEYKVPRPYSYFQEDSLDAFKGTGRCLPKPPCWLVLRSSVTGVAPEWYVQYVEVTTVRPDTNTCNFQRFGVNSWLGHKNRRSPTAVVNNCGYPVALDGSQSI